MKNFVNNNIKMIIASCAVICTTAILITTTFTLATDGSGSTIYTRDELSESVDNIKSNLDVLNDVGKFVKASDLTQKTTVVGTLTQKVFDRCSTNSSLYTCNNGTITINKSGPYDVRLLLESSFSQHPTVITVNPIVNYSTTIMHCNVSSTERYLYDNTSCEYVSYFNEGDVISFSYYANGVGAIRPYLTIISMQ